MADPLIRRAEPDDATAIQRVARDSWHAAYDEIIGADTVDETIEEWYDPDGLRDSTTHADHEVFVAERPEGTVVGFVHAAPFSDEVDTYLLVRIYVVSEEWGSGLGTRLLDCVEERLRERSIERLRLNVFAENEVGVGFYESRGFERVDERAEGGFGVREFVYEKRLSPE
ncbi:N-acetyltransferase family protein [Haladaptatus sp. NG-WS-4]